MMFPVVVDIWQLARVQPDAVIILIFLSGTCDGRQSYNL